ncbi:hypothetical protein AMTRI_Chr06g201490 [Amborella trichopoda]
MDRNVTLLIILGLFVFSLIGETTTVVCIRRCYKNCLANSLLCIGDYTWHRVYPWNDPC